MVNLRLATSERWNDKSTGEKRERTEWHRVVIFDEHICEVASKYLRKGSKVYIEGQLQTRKWTDQQGVEKYSTEVVLNRFRSTLQMLDSAPASSRQDAWESKNRPASADIDDDIPF